MAEELLVTQAANEIVEEVAQSTSSFGGKVMLVISGIAIGGAAGYFFAKRQLETKYSELAENEIKEMREHYLAKAKDLEEKKPDLDEVMTDLGYKTKLEGPDETVYVKVEPEALCVCGLPLSEPSDDCSAPHPPSVEGSTAEPVDPDTDWDYTIELQGRTEDVPYVIHRDEFFGEETDYEQIQLTYYEGDDVLSDTNDTPVDDQDAMVGLGNLSKFGHGSGDPNVVYIRNHELQLEIEVTHSDGKFAEEVHGFTDDELKHSFNQRRRRARRRYDDD